jgi:hypothetical protein
LSDTDNTQEQDAPVPVDADTGTDDKDWKAEADKWKALARKHETQAKTNADAARKVAELEDAGKTEIQRAADTAAQAEQRAATAEARLTRMEVALDKAPEGMPLAKVRKLAARLTGDSREELEADAEDLFADFAPEPDTGDETEPTSRRRPREQLRPGAVPDVEPVPDDASPIERLTRAYSGNST